MIVKLSSVTCYRLVNSHFYDNRTSYRTQFDNHGEKLQHLCWFGPPRPGGVPPASGVEIVVCSGVEVDLRALKG